MAVKGKIIKWIRNIAVAFALAIACLYLFRDVVLHKALRYISNKVKKDYRAVVSIKDASVEGFLTAQLINLAVVSAHNDTIVSFDTLEVTPAFASLFLLRLRVHSINAVNGMINVIKTSNKPDSTLKPKTVDYAERISHLLNAVFNRIPEKVELTNIYLNYENDSLHSHLYIPYFNLDKGLFTGQFKDETFNDLWRMTGYIKPGGKSLHLNISPGWGYPPLPLLYQLFHVTFAFRTADVNLNIENNNPLSIQGSIIADNLSVYQPKLADETIITNNFSFNYHLNFTNHSAEVDSSSTISVNDIVIHPYFQINNENNRKELTLNLRTDALPSSDFFHSLPQGMFNATRDIKADGELEYLLHFKLNTKEPDSLEFTSEMKKNKFRIKEFGSVNFTKINGEFEYTAYEHDKPFRTFVVGLSNPDFTPLDNISPYLRNAILTSEDGSFFFHNGFNEDAFRKSIAENYRKEGFARGGSTITMQLVKNLFLNRHKTIARKAEEALIVWLIESNRLCSKERMFEVYLNIIELGPGIYGVGEASRYYFNKPPAQLTLSESIFIASLLPRPKWFKYSFDDQGHLKPYFNDYYRVVSNFLLRKELITQEEYNSIEPNVKLTGPARLIVTPSDSIPAEEEEQ